MFYQTTKKVGIEGTVYEAGALIPDADMPTGSIEPCLRQGVLVKVDDATAAKIKAQQAAQATAAAAPPAAGDESDEGKPSEASPKPKTKSKN